MLAKMKLTIVGCSEGDLVVFFTGAAEGSKVGDIFWFEVGLEVGNFVGVENIDGTMEGEVDIEDPKVSGYLQ